MLTPGSLQPSAAEGQRREGRLEQQPLRLPLIDVVALHDAVPAPHLLLVAGADPAGGVDVEVAADLATAEPGAQQQLRRPQGAPSHDHRPPRPHHIRPTGLKVAIWTALSPVGGGGAVDAYGAAVFDEDAACLDAGA